MSEITGHGLEVNKVHYSPPLCLPSDVRMETWNDVVRCANRIEDVTCPTCIYYFTHPMERDNRNKKYEI